ncbi:hypothetical protein SESBI_31096 [Sesbania bispinosa]|nr:hypothetical protein SESBI_31096 [Sesbania bispinosa]
MDSILPSLVARARGMIEHNNEGRHMLAMTVILCSTTWPTHGADEEVVDLSQKLFAPSASMFSMKSAFLNGF